MPDLNKPRQCKRPSTNEEVDRKEAHKEKMMFKARRRDNWYKQRQGKPLVIRPNLSKNHPNRNKHPREAYL